MCKGTKIFGKPICFFYKITYIVSQKYQQFKVECTYDKQKQIAKKTYDYCHYAQDKVNKSNVIMGLTWAAIIFRYTY